jgi:hypothetical protein
VVILVRDFEPWFASCQAAFTHRVHNRVKLAVWRVLIYWNPKMRAMATHMDRKQREIWGFEWHAEDAREKARAFYDAYYAECRARIPEHRRIEFRVQDGWAPLCAHLGFEEPAAAEGGPLPFPRTNEAAVFKATVQRNISRILTGEAYNWLNRITLFGTGVYVAYRLVPFVAKLQARLMR